jgi:hypothetical protein
LGGEVSAHAEQPVAGQVWRPTRGKGGPREVMRTTDHGGVYTCPVPRRPWAIPFYQTRSMWLQWLSRTLARPDAE